MKYTAVIFDLDGTLLDTLEDIAESMNFALRSVGFPTHEITAYRYFVGDGITNLVKRALPPEYREDGDVIKECLHLMREEYSQRWELTTSPYPGIPQMLDELSLRLVKMAVFSNKPDDFTRQVVNRFLKRWKFEVVLGARDDMPVKPDPAGALLIAKKLNCPPAQILYIGDTDTDMRTAREAGMIPVGVKWGFREKKELIDNGAKFFVNRPPGIVMLVDGEIG